MSAKGWQALAQTVRPGLEMCMWRGLERLPQGGDIHKGLKTSEQKGRASSIAGREKT